MIGQALTKVSKGNQLRLSLLVRYLFVCTLLLCPTTHADDSQEKELDNLKRSITNLERKLEDRGKQRNSLQSALKKVELESSKITRNILVILLLSNSTFFSADCKLFRCFPRSSSLRSKLDIERLRLSNSFCWLSSAWVVAHSSSVPIKR